MLFCALNSDVTPEHIHPDAIRVSFGFSVTPQLMHSCFAEDFIRYLNQRDQIITVNARRRQFKLNVPVYDHCRDFIVTFNRASRRRPLFFSVTINPISLHNQLENVSRSGGRTRERAYAKSDNFIRVGDPVTSMQLQEIAQVAISSVHNELCDLISEFYAIHGGAILTCADIRIMQVELAADYVDLNSTAAITHFERNFPSAFQNTIRRKYQSSFMTAGVRKNARFVEGFHSSGIRAKAYEKTTRRLRGELQVGPKTFKRLDIDNRLGGEEFTGFYADVLEKVFPLFCEFSSPLQAANDEITNWGDIELLAELVAGCQPKHAAALVNRLVHNASVPSSFMPTLRRRLMSLGIIERPMRGLYRATPQYQAALSRIDSFFREFAVR